MTIVKHFDTIGQAVAFTLASRHKLRHDSSDDTGSWYGGLNLRAACDYVCKGAATDSREMRAAVSLLDRVDASAHNRKRIQWHAEQFGGYPVVGEFLAGVPAHMRHRTIDESDASPVRVYFESAVSAGVDDEELLRRGAAIAALAQRMSEERPTELYVIDALRLGGKENCVFSIRLDTCPINMAQAVAVFASRQFARKVAFSLADAVSGERGGEAFNGGWGFGYPGPERDKAIRAALNMEPQDILLQGGFLTDAKLMHSDPVAWVNKFLDAQRSLEE